MSLARRRTTRRRAMFAQAQGSPGPNGTSPFAEILKALDKADSFGKILSLALRSELLYFRRPMDVLHYRKVAAKVSKILQDLVVPLVEKDIGRHSFTDGLIPIDNLKLKYKFITNMQYFSATGKFQIQDPFQFDALVPEEKNSVFISLYLRMPPELESLPEAGTVPKGTIPFLRVTYRIVRGNKLFTGETREKWKWNLKVPTQNPVVLGMKNGSSERLAIEFRHSMS